VLKLYDAYRFHSRSIGSTGRSPKMAKSLMPRTEIDTGVADLAVDRGN